MSGPDEVIVEVTLPAPADTVWRMLRDPVQVRRWFGWDYEGLDDEIRHIFVDSVDLADDKVLGWENGDRFVLEPDGQQTILRVTRPAPAAGASWDEVYDDITEGWITFVQQLRFALTRHAQQDRRTVFLGGYAIRGGVTSAPVLLGLADTALHPGLRYETTAVTGEVLSGEVWHRTPHQTGVTVDQYGDGLIVAVEYDATSRPPHGGADVVITTYGMDDAALGEVDARWRAWWRDNYGADDA